MNFSLHPALLFGLTLTLVAVFALASYWFTVKRRSAVVHSPIDPRSVHGVTAKHPASDFDQLREWEAYAPPPDHVLHAIHESGAEPLDITPPFGRHEAPAGDVDTPDGSHDQQVSIDPLLSEAAKPESAPMRASAATASSSSEPPLRCPSCLSSRIDTRNRARKAGSTIGSVAGATGGMAAALAGAETGAVVGSIAGPIGTVFGGLAGAVIAGLVGSAAGCAAGSAVGGAIDDNVLDNYQCLGCGHAFSVKQAV
ncbi:hypothetical protein DR63_1895 [Burkholderia thailandensis E264]|uniref:hypothetical protein n=1 Tax=Burkholderia thailandensis TaxID=57975 RepID=UPI0004F8856F|nr:hypothetical protein [Burkholderia thailandensis]AIP25008.1 hypothetical protein DR63_1895 [Burkholderia thailandensis E264]AJX98170.1 hypothetical protein BG87_427 [Burkholderia thailandensis 2002721643]